MFLYLLILAAGSLFAVFMITQIIYPILVGLPLFPSIGRSAKLDKRLAQEKEDLREARLVNEIRAVQKEELKERKDKP